MNGLEAARMNGSMNELINEELNELIRGGKGWINLWMNERMQGWMNLRMNERMNKWMDEWMRGGKD